MNNATSNIRAINVEALKNHPFSLVSHKPSIERILPAYLAMSLAFPYLQAGSQAAGILSAIKNNQDLDEKYEITSVVGNFLSWDETGGAHLLERHGKSGLPEILNTRIWFHANILRKDIEQLTGSRARVDYTGSTGKYLTSLFEDLSSECPLMRCATMVAFEAHAQAMIDSLWDSIVRVYQIEANSLTYFRIHVGGDDPAEKYHTEVTERMIQLLVPQEQAEFFSQLYSSALEKNLNWCAAVIQESIDSGVQQECCM